MDGVLFPSRFESGERRVVLAGDLIGPALIDQALGGVLERSQVFGQSARLTLADQGPLIVALAREPAPADAGEEQTQSQGEGEAALPGAPGPDRFGQAGLRAAGRSPDPAEGAMDAGQPAAEEITAACEELLGAAGVLDHSVVIVVQHPQVAVAQLQRCQTAAGAGGTKELPGGVISPPGLLRLQSRAVELGSLTGLREDAVQGPFLDEMIPDQGSRRRGALPVAGNHPATRHPGGIVRSGIQVERPVQKLLEAGGQRGVAGGQKKPGRIAGRQAPDLLPAVAGGRRLALEEVDDAPSQPGVGLGAGPIALERTIEKLLCGLPGTAEVTFVFVVKDRTAQRIQNLRRHAAHPSPPCRASVKLSISSKDKERSVPDRETDSMEWAAARVSYGNERLNRSSRDRAADVEKAVEAFRSALEVYTRESAPHEWGITQMNLGNALQQRLRGNPADNLEAAIQAYEAALGVLTRQSTPEDWALTQMNRAVAYSDRVRGSRRDNLEVSIAGYGQALEVLTREAYPLEWAATLVNLGASWTSRIEGDPAANLERAIDAYRQALEELSPEEAPYYWSSAQVNLGKAWANRVLGDPGENLERAIDAYRAALDVESRVAGPAAQAATLMNLGIAYAKRIRGDRAENLEEALGRYQQALARISRDLQPKLWASLLHNIANACAQRVCGDRAENLEEAITAYWAALEVRTPEDDPWEWAGTIMNLGVAYVHRVQGDRAENLEEGILCLERALEVRTREAAPFEWASAMTNLGMACRHRVHGDRAANLERAIACFRQALEVRTREAVPQQWAATQMNLGNACSHRIRGDRQGNLEEAIAAFERALEVWTPESAPADWATAQMNLGTAWLRRIAGAPVQNLEHAIRAFREALKVHTREAMPLDWAVAMVNLGSAFAERIEGDRAENLETALDCYRQALEVRTREATPLDWSLTELNYGAAWYKRLLGDRDVNLGEAIAAYRRALTVLTREAMPLEWATALGNLGSAHGERSGGDRAADVAAAVRCYRLALEVLQPDTFPAGCRRVATLLGDLCFSRGSWAEAVDSYDIALRAAETLYRSSLLPSSREAEIASSPDLYRNAAYCLARLGRSSAAVTTLERGRARGLSEALARDRANLEALRESDQEVYERYRDAAGRQRRIEAEDRIGRDWTALGEVARQTQEDLSAAVEQIRALPGWNNFLREPGFEDVVQAVGDEGPLCYLATTPTGGLALLVSGPPGLAPRVDAVWCDALESHALEAWLGPPPEGGGYLAGQAGDGAVLRAVLPPLLAFLGKTMMGPVAARLRELGARAVFLIPCGPLGLLPLHAASYAVDESEVHLFDEMTVSYAPSARVLASARNRLHSRLGSRIGLAGAGNPLPPPRGHAALPGARAELEALADLFPWQECQPLLEQAASKEALLAAAGEATYVHLACHAEFKPEDPLSSVIHLAGSDSLSLREILARAPFQGARMVVLSACQSAVIESERLPDEAIGFPAGLLQAGSPSAVGSLWKTDDLAALLLMVRFYTCHLHRDPENGDGPLPPARALGRAQSWLRKVEAQELRAFFRSLQGAEPRGLASVAALAVNQLAEVSPEDRPFAHPYLWAPFVALGV